jgi:hypothetical protein
VTPPLAQYARCTSVRAHAAAHCCVSGARVPPPCVQTGALLLQRTGPASILFSRAPGGAGRDAVSSCDHPFMSHGISDSGFRGFKSHAQNPCAEPRKWFSCAAHSRALCVPLWPPWQSLHLCCSCTPFNGAPCGGGIRRCRPTFFKVHRNKSGFPAVFSVRVRALRGNPCLCYFAFPSRPPRTLALSASIISCTPR